MKTVAVLYPGYDAADTPAVLGCAENALGLGDSLGDEHELIPQGEGGASRRPAGRRRAHHHALPLRRRRAESLMNFIQDCPIRDDYVMVSDGEIQSGSYKAIYG